MSPNRRLLFVHAGTHKTGSTSIQAMLGDSREAMERAGLKVVLDHPANRMMRTNCNTIAHAFVRHTVYSPTRINGTPGTGYGDAETLRHLAAQFEDWSFERFLLSAESLCYMRTRIESKHFTRYFSGLGLEILPFLYFRNDADWRASWDSQIAKQPRVNAFRRRYPQKFDFYAWYFDRTAIEAFWRGISERAVFLDYDEEVRMTGSVIPSFLSLTGLAGSFAAKDYRLNRRV